MNVQILSPSVSTCTDAGGPISLPPGSLAYSPPGTAGPPPSASPLTGRYGLSVCPWVRRTTSVAKNEAIENNTIHPARRVIFGISGLSAEVPTLDVPEKVFHIVLLAIAVFDHFQVRLELQYLG